MTDPAERAAERLVNEWLKLPEYTQIRSEQPWRSGIETKFLAVAAIIRAAYAEQTAEVERLRAAVEWASEDGCLLYRTIGGEYTALIQEVGAWTRPTALEAIEAARAAGEKQNA